MAENQENKAVTAVKAVSAISSIFSFMEKAAIALFMMFMERAKIREKKAEDNQAKAESDKVIAEHELKVEKGLHGKTDPQIIDDFLNGTDSVSGPSGTISVDKT